MQKKKIAEFYKPILNKEKKQHDTTHEICRCGETKLLSAMMRVDIPCSHQLSIGKPYCTCPTINLKLNVKYEVQLRTEVTPKKKLGELLFEKAAFKVRRRSKCKNKSQIKSSLKPIDVERETQFANGLPKNYFVEVSKGIHKFHDFKKSDK